MSATEYDYFDHHETIKGIPKQDWLWTEIIAEIDALVEDESATFFKAKDLDCDYDTGSVSRCITKLAECDKYPHDLAIWGWMKNPPRIYKVESNEP